MHLTDTISVAPQSTTTPKASHWQASLQLGFSNDQGVTRLTQRQHSGPLRVQKPLYPEGGEICHAIIIHPPGGVVGGDQLAITTTLAAQTHALITTPGAAKWYRSNDHISQQHLHFNVADKATLEWLPQETIFFDDACVDLHQVIHLGQDARYIGGDILCFGRTASGESYRSGCIRQHSKIYREGKLIWFEQGAIDANDDAMHSRLGLVGQTVCATLLASGALLNPTQLAALRDDARTLLDAHEVSAQAGATQMKQMLVLRYMGNSSEVARLWMQCVWRHVRPVVAGQAAVIPRIWQT